ncbi:MAG: FtsX-like permease family protein [Coriobacteriia bacterium]|nr:FtsX-like permease family protein [Coriobacteriia bacterium]
MAKYPEAIAADLLEFLEKYGPKFIENFIYEFSAEVGQFISDLFEILLDDSGPSLIEFDPQKFSKSMGINVTKNDINQLMLYIVGATEHTYKGNLADFGYDDLESPIGIAIYPKDYESKTQVVNIIDNYNEEMVSSDQESKFVTYTDDASSTIGAAQVVVKIIAALLIFFVSSAFISSTLLLGVIFGLSTISRRREVGIMRALGARRRDITRMFNCETLLIGFFAGVLGVIVALLICAVINGSANAGFDICILPIGGAIVLIVVSILLMLFAGFVPAKIASKKDPVKAIRGL